MRRDEHAHASPLLQAINLDISAQMAGGINLKKKIDIQNTFYIPVASSLVS